MKYVFEIHKLSKEILESRKRLVEHEMARDQSERMISQYKYSIAESEKKLALFMKGEKSND